MRAAVLVVALAGCDAKDPPSPTTEIPGRPGTKDVLEGTLTIGGQPSKLVACRPGHATHVFVDVETARGTLRFADLRLSWSPAGQAFAPLDCARLDRSWGGGVRVDGSAYWRGTLDFSCRHGETPVQGRLTLDCGKITAAERASLDANRVKLRAQQGR